MGGVLMIRIAILVLSVFLAGTAQAQERFITLSSTTSTQDSGLFDYVLPIFKTATGLSVHVVAVGTGQALAIGERGDADALLVHDRPGEDKFAANGFGIDRRDVMYNDFVIVGPSVDPASIHGLKSATKALAQIAAADAPFASRGDDSGTNRMELRLWKSAGLAPDKDTAWYRNLGQGMGATLNIAAASNMGEFQEPSEPRNSCRGRCSIAQPLWQHSREPGQMASGEIRGRKDMARMANVEARS
jgi:tungstate transport system substrate-binding protein